MHRFDLQARKVPEHIHHILVCLLAYLLLLLCCDALGQLEKGPDKLKERKKQGKLGDPASAALLKKPTAKYLDLKKKKYNSLLNKFTFCLVSETHQPQTGSLQHYIRYQRMKHLSGDL